MRLRVLSPFLALFLSACGGHAGSYLIEPAPLWAPQAVPAPQATPVVEAPLSPTAEVLVPAKAKHKVHGTDTPTQTATLTATPTATPTQSTGFYLMPFQDKRREKALWAGRGQWDNIVMEAAGSTALAKAWHERPYDDIAYLWHRQFAFDLADSGFVLQSAELPLQDEAAGLALAKAAGAKVLLNGKIVRLNIAKRGADDLIGTNFTGTNYFLNLELQLRVVDVNTGRVLQDRKLEEQRKFYDPTSLGSSDHDTFPRYFATGFPDLSHRIAGDAQLRALANLPVFTATPTSTQTPEVIAPKAGGKPTLEPTATPDLGPNWVNPKTGERVDPNWNFDPKDGTPRDKFVLRQPTAVPTPRRPTEAK